MNILCLYCPIYTNYNGYIWDESLLFLKSKLPYINLN